MTGWKAVYPHSFDWCHQPTAAVPTVIGHNNNNNNNLHNNNDTHGIVMAHAQHIDNNDINNNNPMINKSITGKGGNDVEGGFGRGDGEL